MVGSSQLGATCVRCFARSGDRPGSSRTLARGCWRSSAANVPDVTGVLYADTSALVKLAVDEAESEALRLELDH